LSQARKYNKSELEPIYRYIKDYYLSLKEEIPGNSTLGHLKPLLEVVYYTCEMGAYDLAWQIYWKDINQEKRYTLKAVLGAYDTALITLKEFFPIGDTAQEPLVNSPASKYHILIEVGFSLMGLGKLSEAQSFYKRAKTIAINIRDWRKVSECCQRLAELNTYLGEIFIILEAAREAFSFATQANSCEWEQMNSLVYQAIALYLAGDLKVALELFQQAEALQQKIDGNGQCLYSWRGIWYIDCLKKSGDHSAARTIAKLNLEICEIKGWRNLIAGNYRAMADIEAEFGNLNKARRLYDNALEIAQSISRIDSLIAILSRRGRLATRQGDMITARSDLECSLSYAVTSGYRLYEADTRIGLAWMLFHEGNLVAAQQEAEQAKHISEKISYYWGKIDVEKVLARLKNQG
jgi:tetratricopeptide (TPR) repeat protein